MNEAKKGRVFVVQKTMRWDAQKGELVPKFDLTPAERHGQIEYLLSPTASPFRPDALLDELHEKLSTITEDDCLLLAGNQFGLGGWFHLGLLGAALCFAWEYWSTRSLTREACFKAFLHNHWAGLIIFISIVIDYATR